MKTIRIFGTRGLTLILKMPHSLKNSCFILTAALSISLGFVPAAFATTSWLLDPNRGSVIQLGSLGGDTYATDINDAGQVVGTSYTTTGLPHAFITGRNGVGITDLGTLGGAHSYASGINASGQVAGTSELGDRPWNRAHSHAFITGPNGVGMRDLGALPGSIPESNSYGYGINDAGQVVGTAENFDDSLYYYPDFYDYGYITGPNGDGMRAVFKGSASVINNSGQVAGVYIPPPKVPSAGTGVITGPDGKGGAAIDTIYPEIAAYEITVRPSGINDAGQVVGFARGGFEHGFITGPNGVGATELNFLPGANDINETGEVAKYFSRDVYTRPADINNTGEVVGSIYDARDGSSRFPFITGPNGVGATDLNSLVDMPEGVVLTTAIAINNLGQVIALSPVNPIPEPSSYALMLAGLGLIGFMARGKKSTDNIVTRG